MVEKLNQINVMLRLVNRNWEGDLNQSKSVQIRTPGNISLSTYTPNSTSISYQDLTPTKETFTVSDSKYFAFECDDVDKAQSDINALDTYSQRAVVALNNTIEAKLMAAYSSAAVTIGSAVVNLTLPTLTPVITAGAVSSVTITAGGTGITVAPILQFIGGDGNSATATCSVSAGVVNAVTVVTGGNNYTVAPKVLVTTASGIVLDGSTTAATGIYPLFTQARAIHSKQNVPLTVGARWAVIDPDTTSLLMNDTAHFIRATDLGDNVVQYALVGGETVVAKAKEMPGFIGMIAGYLVFESNHVPVVSTNKFLLFGDNEAISYASQLVKMEMIRLQTSFADAIRGLLLHDTFVAAENSKRLIAMRCVA